MTAATFAVLNDTHEKEPTLAALTAALAKQPADLTVYNGDVFDDVLLYQDQCQRGREDGEVIALLRQGLEGARRTSDIEEVRGEFKAIDTAMGKLDEGDLCLILVDQIDEALAHIAGKLVEAA